MEKISRKIFRMLGDGRRKSKNGNWQQAGAMLTVVWALLCLAVCPERANASAAQEENPLVIVGGKATETQQGAIRTGVLIDAGQFSIVVTSEDVDWKQYQCMAIKVKDGTEIKMEYATGGGGASLFVTDKSYGGYTKDEICSNGELSNGDKILFAAYDTENDRLVTDEGYISDFHENKGDKYVSLLKEFDSVYLGAPAINEGGKLAGIMAPLTIDGEQRLILSIDRIADVIFGGGGSSYGENKRSDPSVGEPQGNEQEYTESPREGKETPETQTGMREETEPQAGIQDYSMPDLAHDSYFMPLLLLVIAAIGGSLFVYTNNKKKRGGSGHTVFLENQMLQEAVYESGRMSGSGVEAAVTVYGTGGCLQGRTFNISKAAVIFGRNPAWCTAVYPQNTRGVSGMHCKVEMTGGKVFITDLGSSYGTFLGNGTRLSANMPYELHRGDSFYLAERVNTFQVQ
ncbi:FHA domain-containing protein [Lachnospiraceae bacterium 46-15]